MNGVLQDKLSENVSFIRKNPECAVRWVYLKEIIMENLIIIRPTFCSIMDSCIEGGYGEVNVEGFAIGSIQNQGFYYAFNQDTDQAKIGFNADDLAMRNNS